MSSYYDTPYEERLAKWIKTYSPNGQFDLDELKARLENPNIGGSEPWKDDPARIAAIRLEVTRREFMK